MVQVDPLARAMRYQPDEESCWNIPVCLNYNRLTATLTGTVILFLTIGFILTIVLLFPYSPSYTFENYILSEFVSTNDQLRINLTIEIEVKNLAVPTLTVYDYGLRLKYDANNYVLSTLEIPKVTVGSTTKLSYFIFIDSELQSISRSIVFEISRELRRKNYVMCSLVGGFNAGYMFIKNGVHIDLPVPLSDQPSWYQQHSIWDDFSATTTTTTTTTGTTTHH